MKVNTSDNLGYSVVNTYFGELITNTKNSLKIRRNMKSFLGMSYGIRTKIKNSLVIFPFNGGSKF
jgi:hypothetical protein